MRNAIFKKFLQMLFLALLLNSIIFYTVSSSALLKKSRSNMMVTLETADSLLDYGQDLEAQAGRLTVAEAESGSRFTIIRNDGTVAADSGTSDVKTLENHKDREEVKEALEDGQGQAVRRSETLGKQMLYVAMRSADGAYILRLSAPFTGMQEYLELLFPAVLLSFAVAFIGSGMEVELFARSITRPLREISRQMSKMDGDYSDFTFEPCPYGEINVIAETTTKMAKNVQESMNRLEQEKQIRQEFFSNASHELKTPITSIRGYVELLENGVAADEDMGKDFLSRIKKEAFRMTSLVDDILMISMLESRGAKADITPIRVRDLTEEITSSLAPMAAEHSVLIHRSCEDLTIWADLRQMTELFTNLLSNAVKYNNPGGQVWIRVKREGNQMVLTVKDSGVGIPGESQARIFERFYRVDKGRSRKQGGTGLGLSIVKHVVSFYDGTVRVESEMGVGSTFTVLLPVLKERI